MWKLTTKSLATSYSGSNEKKSLEITNTTNKPVFIDNKHVLSLKLIPTTVIDTTFKTYNKSYYKKYKPRDRPPFLDTETIGLIKLGKTDLEPKVLLDSVHTHYK